MQHIVGSGILSVDIEALSGKSVVAVKALAQILDVFVSSIKPGFLDGGRVFQQAARCVTSELL